jgi:hypothetical protein
MMDRSVLKYREGMSQMKGPEVGGSRPIEKRGEFPPKKEPEPGLVTGLGKRAVGGGKKGK